MRLPLAGQATGVITVVIEQWSATSHSTAAGNYVRA